MGEEEVVFYEGGWMLLWGYERMIYCFRLLSYGFKKFFKIIEREMVKVRGDILIIEMMELEIILGRICF